jgi:hypothetical protein
VRWRSSSQKRSTRGWFDLTLLRTWSYDAHTTELADQGPVTIGARPDMG